MSNIAVCLCTIITMVIAIVYANKSGYYDTKVGYRSSAGVQASYDETEVRTYILCLMKCSDGLGCQAVNYR